MSILAFHYNFYFIYPCSTITGLEMDTDVQRSRGFLSGQLLIFVVSLLAHSLFSSNAHSTSTQEFTGSATREKLVTTRDLA